MAAWLSEHNGQRINRAVTVNIGNAAMCVAVPVLAAPTAAVDRLAARALESFRQARFHKEEGRRCGGGRWLQARRWHTAAPDPWSRPCPA